MTPENPARPTSSPPRPAPGDDLTKRPRPSSPTPMGDEVALESNNDHTNDPTSSRTTGTTWSPNHPNTTEAWTAIRQNLEQRQAKGLWSSREICVAIATNTGLSRHRAVDLVTSAIRHGHLEERDYPDWCKAHHAGHTQVRLADPLEVGRG